MTRPAGRGLAPWQSAPFSILAEPVHCATASASISPKWEGKPLCSVEHEFPRTHLITHQSLADQHAIASFTTNPPGFTKSDGRQVRLLLHKLE